MKGLKNVLIGAALAAPIGLVGSYVYFFKTQPQQLKRACWDATLKSLVAPSTAKLVDFRLVAPGSSSSPIDMKMQAKLNELAVKETAAIKEHDSADSAASELSQKILSHQYVSGDDTVYRWERARDQEKELRPKVAQASADVEAARAELRIYRERKFPEIVLQVDAQNRASAMLRSEAVCIYVDYPGDLPRSLSTVTLAQLEQR
jgi:hypothetical protein